MVMHALWQVPSNELSSDDVGPQPPVRTTSTRRPLPPELTARGEVAFSGMGCCDRNSNCQRVDESPDSRHHSRTHTQTTLNTLNTSRLHVSRPPNESAEPPNPTPRATPLQRPSQRRRPAPLVVRCTKDAQAPARSLPCVAPPTPRATYPLRRAPSANISHRR